MKVIGGPIDGEELPDNTPGVRFVVSQRVNRDSVDLSEPVLGYWFRNAVYDRDGDVFRFSHYTEPEFHLLRL